jgi:pimeloyl-ACP methyl ester carboxylesterase
MRMRNWVLLLGGLPTLLALLCGALYIRLDRETETLSDDIRSKAGGNFLRLPDGVVHYEMTGPAPHVLDARVVVLIHGFSVPYYIWDPTFEALTEAGFRVLRYDLYGRGYSDRPDTIYDDDLYDRQLLGLLSGLGIEGPVDLVGLSMGGPIAVTFADRHPERAGKLVLVDSAYHGARRPSFWLSTPYLGEFYMTVSVAPSLPRGQLGDFYDPSRFPDWPDKYRVQMQYRGFRRALRSTLLHFAGRDVREEFARVGQSRRPVLLVWGKTDRTVPVAVTREVLKAVPQAELHVIEEAAHLPHYERPEKVNPILMEFLRVC